jgi:hypothetical protein
MQFGGFAAASTLSRCALGGLELSLQLFVTASLLASAYAAWRRREMLHGAGERCRQDRSSVRAGTAEKSLPLPASTSLPCVPRPLQSEALAKRLLHSLVGEMEKDCKESTC